ncbi:hypothetical protein [Halobellus rufus]|uniref:hypothetical protein n=1 Tax=Halobellus rufus TaxID=1448860 RepID=UPI00067956B7|nr:hypothetical protein [Halobellus rufus]
MTERQAATTAQSADSVRRSLRALADGSAPPEPSESATDFDGNERAEAVVRDAESAMSCAREATAFLRDGRLTELEAAVAAADRRGAVDVAERGRRALATLRALDAALDSGRAGSDTQTRRRLRLDHVGSDHVDPDHFRSARGTVLGRTEQSLDR